MIKARLLPGAQADLLKEIGYYAEAREGLGRQFLAAVETAVQKALLQPGGGSPGVHGTRSRLVKGFPFSVVYRADDRELLVVAIAHHRRQPAYWSSRVG